MPEEYDPGTPVPEDESVEVTPEGRSAAEDLDEDELGVDPLEGGREPPEDWAGADRWGTTPREQREGRPLSDRLAQERPDPAAEVRRD